MNIKMMLFCALILLLAGCSGDEWVEASVKVAVEPGVYKELKLKVSSAHDLEILTQIIEDAEQNAAQAVEQAAIDEARRVRLNSGITIPRPIGEGGY